MNIGNQSDILFKSLMLKRNIFLYFYFNVFGKLPKCLIKHIIKNYIEYDFNITPLSNFLTFKRQRQNLATSFSTNKDKDNKIIYYGSSVASFCNKATYDFEALIISTSESKIYLDSNFSINDDYFVAVINLKKTRPKFLKNYIKNIIHFYLLVSKNGKEKLFPSDVKNFLIPDVNFELQKMFNDLCEKYPVKRISRKIYLECFISECEKKIRIEHIKILNAQKILLRIDFK